METFVQEKAYLFGPVFQHSSVKDASSLDELGRLVEAAGGVEVGRLVQLVKRIAPGTYLGAGKIDELKKGIEDTGANVAVFDEELTPAQARNIEETIETRVIDRSELIMDIFARRARSHQANLQVSLAQLKYKLPRLKRMWTHLDRMHAAIGARGPGETQIETDRRLIRKKIQEYTDKLENLTAIQQRAISQRSDFKVSLVGYTNAGKSTLMKALTSEDTVIADQLFVTLDTLTRKLKIADAGTCLLSDTVGFVNKLPHHLINSFHATLSEAMEADLLLHVVDCADPLLMEHVAVVEDVLRQLGCLDIPVCVVANKVDREGAAAGLVSLRTRHPEALPVSAITGAGLEQLIGFVRDNMVQSWCEYSLHIPYREGELLARIKKMGKVIRESADESGMRLLVHMSASQAQSQRLERFTWPGEHV